MNYDSKYLSVKAFLETLYDEAPDTFLRLFQQERYRNYVGNLTKWGTRHSYAIPDYTYFYADTEIFFDAAEKSESVRYLDDLIRKNTAKRIENLVRNPNKPISLF